MFPQASRSHRSIRSIATAVALAALVAAIPARADEPQNFTYAPKPPGQLVDSQIVYLAGESMHSQWRAVTSKKLVGSNGGTSVYQWYLSIYAIEDTTYKRFYQSPADGGPLSSVSKTGTLWFPLQSVQIVGAADLMESDKPQVEELVVLSHEAGADCDSATLSVLTADAGKIHPAVSLRGDCKLTATIQHNDDAGDTVKITGGKPTVTAVLSYKNGAWQQTPKYFEMYSKAFPHLR